MEIGLNDDVSIYINIYLHGIFKLSVVHLPVNILMQKLE